MQVANLRHGRLPVCATGIAFVRGVPITGYSDNYKRSTQARLNLLIPVCPPPSPGFSCVPLRETRPGHRAGLLEYRHPSHNQKLVPGSLLLRRESDP
jgi:hypothetical protein